MPLFRPELFQGASKKRRYFEGWYFKAVSRDGKAWSFIPGISLNPDGTLRRAFIQTIDGGTGQTRWYDFPFEAFRSDPGKLDIRVGDNRLSLAGVELDLDGPDGRLTASLRHDEVTPFPSRPWCPGIMGPYSFVPFLECRHGLVSLDHSVDGFVDAGDGSLSMDGGRGYIEKDWGSSMPSAWIWTQSNSFERPGVSLMFSLAKIPWLGGSFPGFLCAAMLPDGSREGFKVQVWATWNGARIEALRIADTAISVSITRGTERLGLSMERGRGGLLRAPVLGGMDRRIAESVDAVLRVRLDDRSGLVYEGAAHPAGLETVGDTTSLSV